MAFLRHAPRLPRLLDPLLQAAGSLAFERNNLSNASPASSRLPLLMGPVMQQLQTGLAPGLTTACAFRMPACSFSHAAFSAARSGNFSTCNIFY